MSNRSKLFLISLLAACSGAAAHAAEVTGYGVLTTDYVFRGVSYSDSHPAAQLGGDVSFDSGFYFGTWLSTVDISNGPTIQRDLEVDYYLGYGFEVTDEWVIGASVVSYNFPGTKGPFDYDYVEYSVSANFNDRLWFEYSFSPNLYDSGYETHNYDVYAEWQPIGELTVGAGGGLYDVSRFAGSDYWYWQAGITHPAGVVDIDLRYFDTSDWVPIVSTPERAEERIVLSLRFRF